MIGLTPSTACGRSPSLEEGGLGIGKSKVGRMSADARRVIGATAKPLYAIDGKAEGLDRRNPRPPSLREGDRPVGGGRSKRRRWKEFVPIAFMPNFLLFFDAHQAYEAQEAYEAYEE